MKLGNPFGFTPLPVTFFTTLSFAALFAVLIVIQNNPPALPTSVTPAVGVNISTAGHDLQVLTAGFHPYNSHRNDEVREWLLSRVETILKANGASVSGHTQSQSVADKDADVHVFNDLTTNLTFASLGSPLSVAFTGTNIIVYIRGSEDPKGNFWEEKEVDPQKYLVLLNAHFDSVPSAYGATDDGVGVISVLQTISHFTSAGKQPRRGIVALLNNGEEDYLNGAYAFTQHPIAKHVHTFMNLEGAAAGGRALLFRATDTEVTRMYSKSPYPHGSVATADGFKRHLVRSDTDYSVFNGELGMRGIDVAFYERRSMYHTIEDSTRFTSKKSIWHMLSATLATMEALTSDQSSRFVGDPSKQGGVEAGKGSDGVWFDMLGQTFATLKLHDMFALSVTLLVVTPVFLIAMMSLIVKLDRWYLLARKSYPDVHSDDGVVYLGGWKGFFRYPVAFVLATAAVVGLSLLIVKINPYICYSSEYAVFTTLLTAWLVVMWFFLRGSDSMRPSALQRTFAILWIYIGFYVLLAGNTYAENMLGLGGGYFIVIYFAAVFVALTIAYFEMLALPKKTGYAQMVNGYNTAQASRASSRPRTAETNERPSGEHGDDEADEQTSLLGRRTTFGRGYGSRGRPEDQNTIGSDDDEQVGDLPRPYGREQKWSGNLPTWTWFLQFIALAPVPIILVGQLALLMSASLHQTPSDGNSVALIYGMFGLTTVLLLIPISPFVHRLHFYVPTFLFLVCIGSLIYNLVAFPFSDHSRLKVYFIQRVDLKEGTNQVSLTGLMPYVTTIADFIPSAAGQTIDCGNPDYHARRGLTKCSWSGPMPDPVGKGKDKSVTSTWLTYNVSRVANTTNEAVFNIKGRNTRACRLLFDQNVGDYNVTGLASDPRFPRVGSKGCNEIRLWTREWGGNWTVNVRWDEKKGGSKSRSADNSTLTGRVVCLWSDANDPERIPAFWEVQKFMPTWSMITKLSDGLVEGWKEFSI